MAKGSSVKETEQIVYQKLLKIYPAGLPFVVLRKKIPKCLRRYLQTAVNKLCSKDILSKKNHKYSINQPLK